MRLLFNSIAFFLFSAFLVAQSFAPINFNLNLDENDSTTSTGLKSNIIAEIKLMGDSLTWFGTGQGLAMYDGNQLYSFLSTEDSLEDLESTNILPQGGIPAIAVKGDTLIVSFSGDNGSIQVGGGLVISYDAQDTSGISWEYFSQPVDAATDTIKPFGEGYYRCLPVTVPEANVTYDSDIDQNFLWIASWAGGLRRYDLDEGNWENIPLPMDSQDSLSLCEGFEEIDPFGRPLLSGYYLNPRDPADGGNHNHKAFSVKAYGDTVWVGTANGINKGLLIDEWVQLDNGNQQLLNCIEWEHYSFPNDGLSGNFVVGIERQQWRGKTTIWAATMNADIPGETRGVSYTRDNGLTWNTTLLGERVYNIFAEDSLVLVSSQSGLWKSYDGENWAKYSPAIDTAFMVQSQILTDIVYTSVLDDRKNEASLWIGTANGAANSSDLQGSSWDIFQTQYDSTEFYVYPNPFSPRNHNQLDGEGYVRFNTGKIANTQIELDIFNFAMEKVFEKKINLNSYNGALKWNGRDLKGNLVHNGVYFVRLKYSPNANTSPIDFWDKLIVVK
jgi:ligand-binding sensor domain-containing protein